MKAITLRRKVIAFTLSLFSLLCFAIQISSVLSKFLIVLRVWSYGFDIEKRGCILKKTQPLLLYHE